MTELCHLFSLLQFFLAHEFELRLYGVTGTGLDSSSAGDGGDEAGMMTTVDVTLVCVGFLLPLLTQSLLAVSTRDSSSRNLAPLFPLTFFSMFVTRSRVGKCMICNYTVLD